MRYGQLWVISAIVYWCGLANAQSAIALSEMQSLAQGLDTCVIDTTYYVALETLDDTTNPSSNPAYNFINDQGGTFVVPPDWGYIKPTRVNLVTAFNHWNGPYLTYQAGRTQVGTTPYDQGSPLDPWGNPYYFFSPVGLLRGDTGTVTLDLYADVFDRYTLVSLGPDGVKSGDDILYPFGADVTATALSSVRVAKSPSRSVSLTVPGGSQIIIRGVNLGNTQAGAKILWGAQELLNITSWGSREIAVTLPGNLQGTAALTMQRGLVTSNALSLTVVAPVSAVRDWELFE
jgi:hypothetical protein